MATTRLIAALLVSVVFALTPLAYTRPSDPTWIPGLWDNGDLDEVEALVTDATATAASSVVPDITTFPVCIGLVRPCVQHPLDLRPVSQSSRAPPRFPS
jgi:hypothetical protein